MGGVDTCPFKQPVANKWQFNASTSPNVVDQRANSFVGNVLSSPSSDPGAMLSLRGGLRSRWDETVCCRAAVLPILFSLRVTVYQGPGTTFDFKSLLHFDYIM